MSCVIKMFFFSESKQRVKSQIHGLVARSLYQPLAGFGDSLMFPISNFSHQMVLFAININKNAITSKLYIKVAQEQHLGRKVRTKNSCQTKLTQRLVLASVIYAWTLLCIGPPITITGALKIKIFRINLPHTARLYELATGKCNTCDPLL